jgi:hypothetical protein
MVGKSRNRSKWDDCEPIDATPSHKTASSCALGVFTILFAKKAKNAPYAMDGDFVTL